MVIKEVSNHCQDVIDLTERLKNHVDAFPKKVYKNNLQTTSSCSTFISIIEIINCLIWSFGKKSVSKSNFGCSFSKCLGKGCWSLWTVIASVASQGWLDAILVLKLKFGLGDGIVVRWGFVLAGSGGLEPPTWASRKS